MFGSSRENQMDLSFKSMQVILCVLIALLGIIMAVPLASASLDQLLSPKVPASGLLLWLVDTALFFFLAWQLADRQLGTALRGLLLGLLCRLVITLGMALLLCSRMGKTPWAMLSAMENVYWAYHVLATLTVVALYVWPLRKLAAQQHVPTASEGVNKAPVKQFSFQTASARAPEALFPVTRTAAPKKAEAPSSTSVMVTPPDGFIPVMPVEGVKDIITVPLDVITESIPEAGDILNTAELSVSIPLAYIIPQLRQATVWLTWQQIVVDSTGESDAAADAVRASQHLFGRWVRIPAKYYVPQVPPEYFTKPSSTPPLWMKRPAAPQEAQFVDL